MKGLKLTSLVRALHLRTMYISRYNLVQMKFDLHTFKGKVEETTLINSSATVNFIDYRTVARLWLGTQKLKVLQSVWNIDGTLNKAGSITHCHRLPG